MWKGWQTFQKIAEKEKEKEKALKSISLCKVHN